MRRSVHSVEELKSLLEAGAAPQFLDAEASVWIGLLDRSVDWEAAASLCKLLPDEVLVRLACSSVSRVRALVAMKQRLPMGVFLTLARDEDEMVRSVLARNPHLPPSAALTLQADVSPLVRAAAGAPRR